MWWRLARAARWLGVSVVEMEGLPVEWFDRAETAMRVEEAAERRR